MWFHNLFQVSTVARFGIHYRIVYLCNSLQPSRVTAGQSSGPPAGAERRREPTSDAFLIEQVLSGPPPKHPKKVSNQTWTSRFLYRPPNWSSPNQVSTIHNKTSKTPFRLTSDNTMTIPSSTQPARHGTAVAAPPAVPRPPAVRSPPLPTGPGLHAGPGFHGAFGE